MPEDKPKCSSRLRKKPGLTCRHPAGFRTDHPGVGRCWKHGGLTPIKHGRRSAIKRESLAERIERFAANPDPLNLYPELAQLRALVVDLLERWDEVYGPEGTLLTWHKSYLSGGGVKRPRSLPRFEAVALTIDKVGRMVDVIQKHRADGSISKATFNRVMEMMGVDVAQAVQETGLDEPRSARLLDEVVRRWSAIQIAL